MDLRIKSFLKVLILIVTIFSLGIVLNKFGEKSHADDVGTSVNVSNTAPNFTVDPAENPASVSTSPTNAGSDVTFQATANDDNGDQYYLAICKGTGITAGNDGPPTCTAGNWCISSATNDDSQASCSYTTQSGDSESNAWHAYVCDKLASGASCSSASQGSGDSGSPFAVNHRPGFSAISNNTPQDPGSDITWTTTASDTDTDGTSDTVKLVVCKTAGISADDCDGGASDRWCASSLVASDPTCSYTLPVPTVDQSYDAYVYVVDNHNFESGSANQGTNESYTANNVAPVVSGITLNSGSDISLTENTTTSVTMGATVTDNNACTDIATVEDNLYRSGIGSTSCDNNAEDNDNNCYAQISCSIPGGAANPCDGDTDTSAEYECTVSVQYHADPTDTNTTYSAENWLTTVNASDEALNHNPGIASGVEMLSLVGYDVTSSIDFGSLNAGDSNDPLDKITTITATGNVGLDEELSGTDLTDGGTGTIGVGNMEYALSSSTAYGAGTDLTTSPAEAELNCLKTTDSASAETKNTWWGLFIPTDTIAGSYTGTNTITAVKGEYAAW